MRPRRGGRLGRVWGRRGDSPLQTPRRDGGGLGPWGSLPPAQTLLGLRGAWRAWPAVPTRVQGPACVLHGPVGDRAAPGLGTTPPLAPGAGWTFSFSCLSACGLVHCSHLCVLCPVCQGDASPPPAAGVPWPSLSLSRMKAPAAPRHPFACPASAHHRSAVERPTPPAQTSLWEAGFLSCPPAG